MQYTNHYGLRKPGTSDYVDVNDLNYNADVIDDLLKTHNHSNGNGGQIDHGSLSNLDQDTHLQYLTEDRHDTTDRHTPGTVVPVVTSIGDPGSDTNIPTEKAVRSSTVTAIDNRIPAGTTQYRIPRWSGSKWEEAPMVTLSDSQFFLSKESSVGTSNLIPCSFRAIGTLTSGSSSRSLYGSSVGARSKISSDCTLSYMRGLLVTAYRNVIAGSNDAGTITNLIGTEIEVGHLNSDEVSPTTTQVSGISILPLKQSGTISTFYGIYNKEDAFTHWEYFFQRC